MLFSFWYCPRFLDIGNTMHVLYENYRKSLAFIASSTVFVPSRTGQTPSHDANTPNRTVDPPLELTHRLFLSASFLRSYSRHGHLLHASHSAPNNLISRFMTPKIGVSTRVGPEKLGMDKWGLVAEGLLELS
ncbi:hypothetical protein RRG08_031114 [Elysia crispata]|uniref:Uncharacterized protein n=1 Tax=Elysia crispata TaxID=231223 RepID=A0AAE0ZFE1_9GAST|nr:hypothetical protein RRG08_031114 [Elysia crispata]